MALRRLAQQSSPPILSSVSTGSDFDLSQWLCSDPAARSLTGDPLALSFPHAWTDEKCIMRALAKVLSSIPSTTEE